MGWTAPATVTVGQVLTAALWNAQVRDNDKYLAIDRAHCSVYNNANLSIPNSTRTALTFNSERVDVGTMHSTVTNTSRATAPAAEPGFFLAVLNISWASNNVGQRNCELRLNGATLIGVQSLTAVGTGNFEQTVTRLYQLAAADYLEGTVFQTSGGALVVSAASNYSPELEVIWMCQ